MQLPNWLTGKNPFKDTLVNTDFSTLEKKDLIPLLEKVTQEYLFLDSKYSSKLRTGKDMILLLTKSTAHLVNCQVNDDHTLSYFPPNARIEEKLQQKKRTIEIMTEPQVMKVPRYFGLRVFQFRMYSAQLEGEYTIDPYKDETPVDYKKRIEGMLKLHNKAKKSDIAGNILAGLKNAKKWFDYIPYFIILGIVFFFLLFMFDYNLTKPINPNPSMLEIGKSLMSKIF